MPNIPAAIAICSCLLLGTFHSAPARAESVLFDPFTGYRIAQYRAPVPRPPEGIAALDTDALRALIDTGALLVDVHPLRRFHIAEDGAWSHGGSHASLPARSGCQAWVGG